MTIYAPSLFDLVAGRVSLGDWTADLVRGLQLAEEAHNVARMEGVDSPDDALEQLRADLDALGFELVDFRQAEKSKRGARKGSRPFEQIEGELFHQTAADIDDVERCTRIPAHVLITVTAVGLAHPPTAYLYHGHSANRRFNGQEISCRAAGIEGDPRTFWRSRKERKLGRTYAEIGREPTDGQLEASLAVTRYHMTLNALAGHPLRLYGFHRNSHRSRVSDPGSKAARRLGPGCERLGLRPTTPLGSGTATPEIWSGAPGIRYSRKVPAIR